MALPQEKIEIIPSEKCGSFNTCNAPLCPLDETSLIGPWYPDEAICTRYDYDWIRSQKRIALEYKRMKAEAKTYFNLQMLRHKGMNLIGLNPNIGVPESQQLKKWFQGFPR